MTETTEQSIDFRDGLIRSVTFEIARVALRELAAWEVKAQDGREDIEKRFIDHAEKVVETLGIFADGLLPELAYHAGLLHDLIDRAVSPVHSGDMRLAAAGILRRYYESAGIDAKGRQYMDSVLGDTLYVEQRAKVQRRNFYKREDSETYGLESSLTEQEEECLTNGHDIVSDRLWRVGAPLTNVDELLEISEGVNVESVILKAAEVIHHLERHEPDGSDAGLLRECLEAEAFYAPLCEIWGLDGMAMTLRGLSHQRRFEKMEKYDLLSPGEQQAIDSARRAEKQASDFGGTRVVVSMLFADEMPEEHFALRADSQGRMLADIREDRLNRAAQLRIISRQKTLGSLMKKYVGYAADGKPNARSMDNIASTVVVNATSDIASIYQEMAERVSRIGGEFSPAPSKKYAMCISGSDEFVSTVRSCLPDTWQIETRSSDYQVAKFTFLIHDVPVEIQFITVDDREDARVGHTAHILHKLAQGADSKLTKGQIGEKLKRIRERKHKVSINDAEVNERTISRGQLMRVIVEYFATIEQ